MRTTDEMLKDIETSFKSLFPNGWITTRSNWGMYKDACIIHCGLISNINDQSSRIIDNDPMYHSFILHSDSKGFSSEVLRAGISVNPKEKYLAMSTVKTKWRKYRGDADKTYAAFDKFFKRLRVLLDENADDIYGRSRYPDKYFN